VEWNEAKQLFYGVRSTSKRAAGLYIIIIIAIIMHDSVSGIPRRTGTETGTVSMLVILFGH
jgi:hypothetical protein